MFEVHEAIDEDYEFLFELKRAAEYEPVKAVLVGKKMYKKKFIAMSGVKRNQPS
ncbi:hypothetical protein [Vibrio parahaemolyticus]|uniref:hypothetical protein n=1 Tax=Vibrio parahaemolyticus TaxID=670 RepID=UPI0015D62D48